MGNQKTGIVILSAMACLWCVLTAFASLSSWRAPVIMVAFLVSGLAILLAIKRIFPPSKLDGKIFRLSIVFEGVAIFAVVWALIVAHAASFILAAIAIIVGLHFIGMWRATDNRVYLAIAASQCGFGIVSVWLPIPLRISVAGLGSAIALWCGAFWQLRRIP